MPTAIDAATLAATFRLAGPQLAPGLLRRLPVETSRLLDSVHKLPHALTSTVIASQDEELIAALLKWVNDGRWAALLRLAEQGDPRWAVLLYTSHQWPSAMRHAVLAGAAKQLTDPGWRAPGGLVETLLASEDLNYLIPALRAPFPDVVRHALDHVGETRGVPEKLTAAGAVLRYGGVVELAALVEHPAMRHEVVAQAIQRALNSPSQNPESELDPESERNQLVPLAASAETLPEPPTASDDVDQGVNTAYELLSALRSSPRNPPAIADPFDDWGPIVAAGEFLHTATLQTLAARPNCPELLVRLAFRLSGVVQEGKTVPLAELSDVEWTNDVDARRLQTMLAATVPNDLVSAHWVLSEVRAARWSLTMLPWCDQTSEALAKLVVPLGADFAAWRAVLTLLPRFPGTAVELIDAAVAEAPKHQGRTWPKPMAAEFPFRAPSMARGLFQRLLQNADESVQRALVEHLDLRAVQRLMLTDQTAPALRAHCVAVHGLPAQVSRASQYTASDELVAELLALDEPEVNAKLYQHVDLDTALRRQILAGRRCQPGDPDPLPLTEDLLDAIADSGLRDWLTPIPESGHPRLARLLPGQVRLHTPAAQLLLLTRMWERHGPDTLRAFLDETTFPGAKSNKHPLPVGVRTSVGKLLDTADGLQVLRQRLDHALSPAGQVEFLNRAATGRSKTAEQVSEVLARVEEENGPLPWAALLAAHHQAPLPDALLVALHEMGDCPEEMSAASGPARVRLAHPSHPHPTTGPLATARELLHHHPLGTKGGDAGSWLQVACDQGLLEPMEVLRVGRPARDAVDFLITPLPREAPFQARRQRLEVYREVQRLVATHLGDDLEAWAVAVRLRPDFEGTVEELLSTASAVVG